MSQLDGHTPALVLRDLTKSFSRSRLRLRGPGGRLGRLRYERTVKRVLRGIDLTVDHGEVLGYIGPNGAGKTTTLRMLVGVMHPDSGAVEVYGKSPHHPRTRAQAKRETGSVFGQRSQLWLDLTPKVGYAILGDVYSIPRSEVNRRIHELDEYFGIRDLWDTPVRHLSLGQRMRCDLAAAVLPRPRLLILDEPTIGLDALSKEAFRRFVRHLKAERRTTVLLTTHDMRELGELADRVALVVGGRITFDGSLDDLRKGTPLPVRVTLVVEDSVATAPETVGPATLISHAGNELVYSVAARSDVPHLFNTVSARFTIADLSIEEAGLEQLIASRYSIQERETNLFTGSI